ncbi:calcium-binding protein [Neotabrizicola shimadae]|uniref:Uncharacterized protein n=1 Tax=Neotabrizicola shimadae TaxID=2807096 RepID=A0A8G0ZY88_9RHOB|nr:calcium-binding protein [Neotabrizicola shimadae]QYZ71257.1 hypothetical protein JO391_07060 [Neotabrizicola shimadae]
MADRIALVPGLSAPVPVGEVPDTGGTFATASTLPLDTPFDGTLTPVTDTTDVFRITAAQAGILLIDLTGLGANISVLIYTASQRIVTAAYGGQTQGALQASFLAEPGASYYVVISQGGTGTAYHLNAGYSPFSGSEADDSFTGSAQGEMMAGYAGADSLHGLGGDDRLYGGEGDDSLFGGAGSDRLEGQGGRNLLRGGIGTDFLYAGAEGDTLFGGEGNDYLYGGGGDDSLNGGDGADVLSAGLGNDSLYGGTGADSLYSSDGNDSLYGGDDADYLTDDRGLNQLFGGAGNDSLTGGRDNDQLFGGTGADALYGGRYHDQLDGGDGDDRLYGGAGADSLFGGSGNDFLSGNGGYYVVNSDGLNHLYGGAGADTLTGGEGRDILDLGAGDQAEDVILVNDAAASRTDARMDAVRNFEHGIDYFDFYALDANTALPGNQRFAWGDTTATANGIWYRASGQNLVLSFDTDGDALADGSWRIEGISLLTRDDFIL